MPMRRILRALIRFYGHQQLFDRGKYRLALWGHQHLPLPSASTRVRLEGGLEMEIDPAEFVQAQIYYIGLYEHYLARQFRARVKPGMVVADVGAHVGQYTLLAAGQGAEVHVFEPNPHNLARLQRNLALNGLEGRAVLNAVAVADRVGEATFHLPLASNTGRGTLLADQADSAETVTVPVTTLDAYFEALGRPPDLIKMDVEGVEWLVLRGAMNTLRAHRPILFLETVEESLRAMGATLADLAELLRGLGYTVSRPNRQRLEELPGELPPYDNLICTP